MGTVVGRFVIAAALFAAGLACWSEAAVSLRVAEAREHLATLRYDTRDELTGTMSVTERLPGRVGSLGLNIRRHDATIHYWTARYDEMTAPAGTTNAAQIDPELLLMSANAAFRAGQKEIEGDDRQAAVTRLDAVLQSYSTVLKAVPRYPDVAYNYEFVARVRDAVANGRPLPPRKQEETQGRSSDLPAGRTLHGLPGGTPAGARMEEFEIVTPKRGDERGSDAGTNQAERPRRRG